jgi:hypothetical protein
MMADGSLIMGGDINLSGSVIGGIIELVVTTVIFGGLFILFLMLTKKKGAAARKSKEIFDAGVAAAEEKLEQARQLVIKSRGR